MKNFSKIKIGFFGTSDFALKILKELKINSFQIEYIVTQPPRPSGRGQRLNFSNVHYWSKSQKLIIHTPQNSKDPRFIDSIKSKKVDFIIVVAYGQIISEEILNLPKFFCINVHASLLPRWRGAAPIQRAILSGDSETGISIMKMEKELDAGPIISFKKVKILKSDNSGNIYNKLSIFATVLLIKTIEMILIGKYKFLFQDLTKVTYAQKIKKSETKIDWNLSAEYNHRFIKAFNPWPGAWTIIKESKLRIKILEVEVINNANNSPGVCDKLLITSCGKNSLKLKRLQLEGKKVMYSDEFINGFVEKELIFE